MKNLNTMVVISTLIIGTFALSANAAVKQIMHCSETELKSMDTNKDSMVSKEEFLAYSELAFSKMKLTDGMISLKNNAKSNLRKPMDDYSPMNNKPTGTTTDKPNMNEREAVNTITF